MIERKEYISFNTWFVQEPLGSFVEILYYILRNRSQWGFADSNSFQSALTILETTGMKPVGVEPSGLRDRMGITIKIDLHIYKNSKL